MTPWGDQPAQLANVDNWNPYLTSIQHQRDAMQITINEELFYTNLNSGKLIPWQAESFELSPDFLTATIHLRKGVEWSDGAAVHRRRRQVHAGGDPRRAARAERLGELQGMDQERRCGRSADRGHPLHQAGAALGPRQPRARPREPLSRSCPRTSGRARTSRPSPTTTSPRAGRSAPAPTSWSARPPSRRSSTAATTGGAPRSASCRCRRRSASSSFRWRATTRWGSSISPTRSTAAGSS